MIARLPFNPTITPIQGMQTRIWPSKYPLILLETTLVSEDSIALEYGIGHGEGE